MDDERDRIAIRTELTLLQLYWNKKEKPCIFFRKKTIQKTFKLIVPPVWLRKVDEDVIIFFKFKQKNNFDELGFWISQNGQMLDGRIMNVSLVAEKDALDNWNSMSNSYDRIPTRPGPMTIKKGDNIVNNYAPRTQF